MVEDFLGLEMFFEQVVLWRYPRHEKEIRVIERPRSVVLREAAGKSPLTL